MSSSDSLEYIVNMRAQRVNDNIYRLFFKDIDTELLPYTEFKFEYKLPENKSWQNIRSFDCKACQIYEPTEEIFTYIRIPNKLNDYSLDIRLSLRIFTNAFGFVSNKWMKYSETLTINIPSSLSPSNNLQTGSMVIFKPNHNYQYQYGIIDFISSENPNICNIRDLEQENKIWTNISSKSLVLSPIEDCVDFCVKDRNYADFRFLFRSNKLKSSHFDIYSVLVQYGMNCALEYVEQNEEEDYDGEIAINSYGRSFAYNVMRMLGDDDGNTNNYDYNLKMNCLNDCGSFLKTKTISTINKYRINNGLPNELGFVCDNCQCEVNEFDFMFHCDNKQVGLRHNYCILCIHEMNLKYEYFTELLKPLLLNNKLLNETCIDVLIQCMVGKSIKFEYNHHHH